MSKTTATNSAAELVAAVTRKQFSLGAKLKRSTDSYVLMAPYMILFFVFTVLPVAAATVLSFTNFNMLELPRFTGLMNYIRLIVDDQIFLVVLQNTLLFAVVTGPVSYFLSFFLAWFINDFRSKVRSVLTLVFYLPSLAGGAFSIWLVFFSGDQYGFLNGWLMSLGVIRDPIDWIGNQSYIMSVVVFVQLWASLGAGFLSFIAGFQTVDKSMYEAGAIDGIKNRWQELWYITIPAMAPQLLFGAVMQVSATFGAGAIITQIAGFPTRGYAADTIGTYILDYGTVRFEMGYASTLAVVLVLIMLVINSIFTKVLKRFSDD